MFRPRRALLQDRFKNFSEEQRVKQEFIIHMEKQVGMELPVFGHKMVADKSENTTGLVVGVKRFGFLGKVGELLFEKFDGTESRASVILFGGRRQIAKQFIEGLKEFRITVSRREIQVSEQFFADFRGRYCHLFWCHVPYFSRKPEQIKGSIEEHINKGGA